MLHSASSECCQCCLPDVVLSYPQYRCYSTRLASFSASVSFPPPHFKVTRSSLANEGFFYQPIQKKAGEIIDKFSDRCCCFACGTVLNSWKETDEAHQEHRRHTEGKCPIIKFKEREQKQKQNDNNNNSSNIVIDQQQNIHAHHHQHHHYHHQHYSLSSNLDPSNIVYNGAASWFDLERIHQLQIRRNLINEIGTDLQQQNNEKRKETETHVQQLKVLQPLLMQELILNVLFNS